MKHTEAEVLPLAGSTWGVAWPFQLAVPLFLIATLFDSGRSWTRILGQSPGSLATFFVILFGLLNLRGRRLGLSGWASIFIVAIIAGQVLFQGEDITGAYSLIGPLAMVWVIACQRADEKFVIGVLKLMLLLSTVLAVSFYLGFWRAEEGSMSFPRMSRNFVALKLAVGATLVMFLGRQGHLGQVMRWAWPFAMVAFAVPLLFTASRKGVIALGLAPVLFLGLTSRRLRAVRAALLLAIVAGLVAYTVSTDLVESSEPLERVAYRFEAGDVLRENLAQLAIELIRREPVAGYGVSTAYSASWKAAQGFVDPSGTPLSIHNGLLAIALLGGLPLLGLYLLLLGAGGWRLVSLGARVATRHQRELGAFGVALLSVFVINLLTGGGSEYWKYGYFSLGVVLLIGEVVGRSNEAAHADTEPDPAET